MINYKIYFFKCIISFKRLNVQRIGKRTHEANLPYTVIKYNNIYRNKAYSQPAPPRHVPQPTMTTNMVPMNSAKTARQRAPLFKSSMHLSIARLIQSVHPIFQHQYQNSDLFESSFRVKQRDPVQIFDTVSRGRNV